MILDESVRKRLFAGLLITPEGCVLWQGKLNQDGYGRISIKRRYYQVHRVMWTLFEGEIPEGLTLDHVKERGCRHRNCANVAHLEPTTQRENNLRGSSPTALHAAQTHCVSNHLFDEANTYVYPPSDAYPSGRRLCRTCGREAARRYAAAKKAKKVGR